MKIKYITAVFLTGALLTCSALAARWLGFGGTRLPNAVAAPSVITVTLDGTPMTLDNPAPTMINSRVVVPVAQFAAGIGGTSKWEADTQEIFLYWRDTYIRMQIGNPTLYYGTFIYGDDGSVLLTDVQSYALDTRPEHVSDVVTGQLSALVAGLGGDISWDGTSLTANLTLPSAESVSPRVTAEIDSNATAAVFEDEGLATLAASVFFRSLSPEAAEEKYAGDESFVLLLYDSAVVDNEKTTLRNIMQAAKNLKLRVHGLDLNDMDDGTYFWTAAMAEEASPMLCIIEGYDRIIYTPNPTYNEAYKVLALYRALLT